MGKGWDEHLISYTNGSSGRLCRCCGSSTPEAGTDEMRGGEGRREKEREERRSFSVSTRIACHGLRLW